MTIMGCDDLLLPGYVERMHRLAREHPAAAYIQPGVRVVDGDGVPSSPLPDRVKRHYAPRITGPTALEGEPLATGLARGNWTYFPSICWRRNVLDEFGFDESLDVALDLDLQLRIVDGGGIVVVDDEVTFVYRRHGGASPRGKRTTGRVSMRNGEFWMPRHGERRCAGGSAQLEPPTFASRADSARSCGCRMLSQPATEPARGHCSVTRSRAEAGGDRAAWSRSSPRVRCDAMLARGRHHAR